jgi:hypothetical protein
MPEINDEPEYQELEQMLLRLKEAPIPAPADEIRQNLQRVSTGVRHDVEAASHPARRAHWPRWVFAAAACIAMVLIAGLRYTWRSPEHQTNIANVAHGSSSEASTNAKTALRPPAVAHRKSLRHATPRSTPPQPRSFTVELSYSNRDIANGTSAIISVQVSGEELIALGVPIGDAANDRKYLADVTLGDDGLPRSIQIPLPLRSLD